MSVSEEQVKNALTGVKYPGFSRDIVSFGLVKGIEVDKEAVTVRLIITTNEPAIPQRIKSDAESLLRELPGIKQAKVLIDIQSPPASSGAGVGATRIEGIRHIIAIASGKG